MGYILAFDVGTTAIKAVLVDRASRECYQEKVDCALYRPSPAEAEQDARELWLCLCDASRKVIDTSELRADKIDAVVISAPWKHVIPLDSRFRPLRRSIIWMDARSVMQAERLNEMMGEYICSAQDYWPRLMWLKENEPLIWHEAAHIVGLNTYFKYCATGELYTEPSDDFIHSPNKSLQEHYTKVLKATGLYEDLDKFPPCKQCSELVGYVTKNASLEMRVPEGTPVFGGFGDLAAIPFGCGCTKPGDAHIYLGTSGWLSEIFEERMPGTGNLFFTQDVGLEGALCSLQTVGKAYEWAIDTFYPGKRVAMGDWVYPLVNEEISRIPAGCDKLIATHWLNGEIAPLAKNAKALFFNVDEHHDRRYFVRAILESVCYTLRRGFEDYRLRHPEADFIRVAGGGALNSCWMQILADVLGVRVEIPENPRFIGTMGSYYCAEVGLGGISEYPRDVRIETSYYPNPDNKAVYDKMYRIYCGLYPALKSAYDEINE